jgi:hypothetical protein
MANPGKIAIAGLADLLGMDCYWELGICYLEMGFNTPIHYNIFGR